MLEGNHPLPNADAGLQLLPLEGLDDVVVGAALQAADDVLGLLLRGEQDQIGRFVMRQSANAATDLHAGENETSALLALRPDLVQMDRAAQESGADEKRLPPLPGLYTAIWWYARFPNHYAGEGGMVKTAEVVVL